MQYKRRFGNQNTKKNWKKREANQERKQLLNMRRAKYFGFDLDDLLTEYEIGENKGLIAATITTKMTVNSLDDALEYVDRMKQDGIFDEKQEDILKSLLRRYAKWR